MTTTYPDFANILLLKHHRQPSVGVLKTVSNLARLCGARLTFADTLDDRSQLSDLFRSARLHELQSLLSPHLNGVEADYRLIDGDIAAATKGADEKFDLVYLADDPRASEARGPVITRLLRQSSVPVWLDSGTGRTPRRILATLDISTRDPVKRSLNLPILERALLLASLYGAALDILSVWTPPTTSLVLAHRLAGAPDRWDGGSGEVRGRLKELVEGAVRAGPPLGTEPRILTTEGLPTESIALTTEASGADLLVAGCVGRAGLAAWLIGDTAERLTQTLDCSVLAVKPTPGVLVDGASADRGRAA